MDFDFNNLFASNINSYYFNEETEINNNIINYNMLNPLNYEKKIIKIDNCLTKNLKIQSILKNMLDDININIDKLDKILDENKHRYHKKKRNLKYNYIDFYKIFPKRLEKSKIYCIMKILRTNNKNNYYKLNENNIAFDLDFEETDFENSISNISANSITILKNNDKMEYIKNNIHKIGNFTLETAQKHDFFKLCNKLNTTNYLAKTENPIYPIDILKYITSQKQYINIIENNIKFDINKIKDILKKYGSINWSLNSMLLGYTNHKKASKYLFKHIISSDICKAWSVYLDTLLIANVLVNYKDYNYDRISFVNISKSLNFIKADMQCRERYMNILNPNVDKSPIHFDELYAIFKYINKNKRKNWSKIAELLPGRTDNYLARKYYFYANELNPYIKFNKVINRKKRRFSKYIQTIFNLNLKQNNFFIVKR